MKEKNRVAAGYAALGLVVGLFLFPWVYILTTRYNVAEVRNPVWTVIYLAVILVPGLLFALMGPRRAEENPATSSDVSGRRVMH